MTLPKTFILGAGVTGLAAGYASGLPILEARPFAGGICSSYYLRPHKTQRLAQSPDDQEAYRFEIGGGHWIFGGDPIIKQFLQQLTPLKIYQRRSSVYFFQNQTYIPYPLQNFLRYLSPYEAAQALCEMARPKYPVHTMKDWLEQYFGPTLCQKFFYPFHDLYTAGLYQHIAPQDAYKSPVDLNLAIQGALSDNAPVGYNTEFVYPTQGLDHLTRQLAQHCDIRYGHTITAIDPNNKRLTLADGQQYAYQSLLATLPLNHLLSLAGLQTQALNDPYTSVLVLNLGAKKGPNCPPYHWLYNPDAQSGFHRVGFYSNVDSHFLPQSVRDQNSHVALYIERAYLGGQKPTDKEIAHYSQIVIQELQEWGYIEEVEVLDPTWIEVAYTWSLPNSTWRTEAMQLLQNHHIYPIGRYARWQFQGIADSLKDGFFSGASFQKFS